MDKKFIGGCFPGIIEKVNILDENTIKVRKYNFQDFNKKNILSLSQILKRSKRLKKTS